MQSKSTAGGARPIEITPGVAPRVGRATSLVIAPAVAIVAAVLGEAITTRIDTALHNRAVSLPAFLDRGGVDDVRSLVSTVAGSTITVLALVLSLTMVTLSMAATQFGPRLTAAFLRARMVKVTIGLFTGLFVYSLLVLDSIGAPTDRPFVPEIGATGVLVLALAAVVCLVVYANTVVQSVRLPAVVELVATDLESAIRREQDLRAGVLSSIDPSELSALRERIDDDHVLVTSRRSGYLQSVEWDPLGTAAATSGAVIEVVARPGDFLQAGMPLARISPASAAAGLVPACERHIDLGAFRTIDQDLEFGIDQLVEIALRALSAAINDTYTGITCIDWLGTSLSTLADGPGDRPVLRDADGQVRVITRPRPFPGLVDAAFNMIRQSAAGNPAITIHLIDTITAIVDRGDADRADGRLMEQADMIVLGAQRLHYAPLDWEELRQRYIALCVTTGRTPAV